MLLILLFLIGIGKVDAMRISLSGAIVQVWVRCFDCFWIADGEPRQNPKTYVLFMKKKKLMEFYVV